MRPGLHLKQTQITLSFLGYVLGNLMERSALGILILLVALINAVFHAILVQFIVYSVSNGLYFLVTAILFGVGGFAALSSGKIFKPAILGLFVLSLIDNILIFITASFATPLSGGQVYGWATDLNPPGQVPVFLIQILLMILTAYVLLSKKKTS